MSFSEGLMQRIQIRTTHTEDGDNASASIRPPCTECDRLKKEKEEQEIEIKRLSARLDERDREVQTIKRMNSALQDRSNQLASRMSNILEASGDLECVNDPFSNHHLAREFEDQLHQRAWLNLCDQMEDAGFMSDEIERINYIKKCMKTAFSLCKQYADDQMRHILLLGSDDTLPQQSKEPDLYKIRKQYGQKGQIRAKVRSELTRKLFKEESKLVEETERFPQIKTSMQAFIETFIEACWNMTIANPEIVLNFSVEGRHYEDVRDRFSQYATQEPVTDPELGAGMVKIVVWPCVQQASFLRDGDSEAYYQKGEVITVSGNGESK